VIDPFGPDDRAGFRPTQYNELGKALPLAVSADDRIRIGVSSCLLGERVRYDGGHKRDHFLTEVMGPHVEWVAVCPEFEIGLGVPREPIELERKSGEIRLVSIETRADHTTTMRRWVKRRLGELDQENISGYILKSRSPSCGIGRVQIHEWNGDRSSYGQGLYASALIERFENLPIEEEQFLSNPKQRENFIERAFAYRRLRQLFSGSWRNRDLAEFHIQHELLLMAHSPRLSREIGRVVVQIANRPRKEFRLRYESLFMQAMKSATSRRRHAKVLRQIADSFAEQLGPAEAQELGRIIEGYSQGLEPLCTPLASIRILARRIGIHYLEEQVYLNPHPQEVALRDRAKSFP